MILLDALRASSTNTATYESNGLCTCVDGSALDDTYCISRGRVGFPYSNLALVAVNRLYLALDQIVAMNLDNDQWLPDGEVNKTND